ncbi:MAG: arylsulfotransferase family protein [Actinomycetota bacterium]|nr:arylsulfotransferase family protein [Actinomycetota bacterium]
MRRLTALLVAVAAAVSLAGGSRAAAPAVSVFPVPGSQVVTPQAQIAFRGIPAARLGPILVSGSRSGLHLGHVAADSDGQGGSFLPDRPFSDGETVTVATALNVLGATAGRFTYVVQQPAYRISPGALATARRVPGDVRSFRSRPDLRPAAVKILKAGNTAPGDLFLAPQAGPVQNGPMILDSRGGLVWFKSVPKGEIATDFRVQRYRGRPVLTWWQGRSGAGVGVGEDVIDDVHYHQIAVVRAGNGLSADLHEFDLTPRGTALITAYNPVFADATAEHGAAHQVVLDSVVQEIDVKTGLVLFQWDSLDHVPLNDGYTSPPQRLNFPFDYFHINSVDRDDDGNLLISARNTWAAYKVSSATGQVTWALGGKHSSFAMGPGSGFAFQHDVRVRAGGDAYLTLFDDGAGPPRVHGQSRGLKLKLDLAHMTATVAAQYRHSPKLLADFEGNAQQLPGGDILLGWGQQPYFNEFTANGNLIFDGRFVANTTNYRAYRFPWRGDPVTRPALAASAGRRPMAYASWNGATDVASWRVLGGSSAHSLRAVSTARESGFETAIKLPHPQKYVAAQALNRAGRVLNISPTVRAH